MAAVVRAVGIVRPGGPEVVRVVERSVREAGPGEVRLAVTAAAVDPTDIALRDRGVEGLAPPWVPGMDAAGLVESLGEDIDRLEVGAALMAAVAPCAWSATQRDVSGGRRAVVALARVGAAQRAGSVQ